MDRYGAGYGIHADPMVAWSQCVIRLNSVPVERRRGVGIVFYGGVCFLKGMVPCVTTRLLDILTGAAKVICLLEVGLWHWVHVMGWETKTFESDLTTREIRWGYYTRCDAMHRKYYVRL